MGSEIRATHHTTDSFCESRIYFEPFCSIENGKLKLDGERGIRCHGWVMAFFQRLRGNIVDVTLLSGKVVHLNKASFDKWKASKEALFKFRLSNNNLPEQAINSYCAAKFLRTAQEFLWKQNIRIGDTSQFEFFYTYLFHAQTVEVVRKDVLEPVFQMIQWIRNTFASTALLFAGALLPKYQAEFKAAIDQNDVDKIVRSETNAKFHHTDRKIAILTRVHQAIEKAKSTKDFFETISSDFEVLKKDFPLLEQAKINCEEFHKKMMAMESHYKSHASPSLPEKGLLNTLFAEIQLNFLVYLSVHFKSMTQKVLTEASKDDLSIITK